LTERLTFESSFAGRPADLQSPGVRLFSIRDPKGSFVVYCFEPNSILARPVVNVTKISTIQNLENIDSTEMEESGKILNCSVIKPSKMHFSPKKFLRQSKL